eukprot:4114819-Prymnesium_polylepis.2
MCIRDSSKRARDRSPHAEHTAWARVVAASHHARLNTSAGPLCTQPPNARLHSARTATSSPETRCTAPLAPWSLVAAPPPPQTRANTSRTAAPAPPAP